MPNGTWTRREAAGVVSVDADDGEKRVEQPGLIAIFGSGEAATTSRKVHERLFSQLAAPVEVAILETPAGFQPNVDVVSAKIQGYLEHHLQNYKPQVTRVRARRKGSADDPDDPAIVAPLLTAGYIIAGPGSPTYTIRQLRDTLALRHLVARHQAGAMLALASAAAIALSGYALPVYEIFKAGDDLQWMLGLDFFGSFGLDLAVLPHWNNGEGGRDLDTSHCFVGEERFLRLRQLLPSTTTVLGIDEHTACVFDFARGRCDVMGKGTVTVLTAEATTVYPQGMSFDLSALDHVGGSAASQSGAQSARTGAGSVAC